MSWAPYDADFFLCLVMLASYMCLLSSQPVLSDVLQQPESCLVTYG